MEANKYLNSQNEHQIQLLQSVLALDLWDDSLANLTYTHMTISIVKPWDDREDKGNTAHS